MAELQRKQLCPRLLDYLAIVGVRQTSVHHRAGGGPNPPVQVCKIQFSYLKIFFPIFSLIETEATFYDLCDRLCNNKVLKFHI